MRVIGIGLPRTGNTSLCSFLNFHSILCAQYDYENAFINKWELYDAIVDFPMCIMFPYLMKTHPTLKAVLTVRLDTEDLFASTLRLCTKIHASGDNLAIDRLLASLELLYGSDTPSLKDVTAAQDRVIEMAKPFIEEKRVLVLPVDSPIKAQYLCTFLDIKYYGSTYPHENAIT
jgi:hypothetical protein